MMDEGKDRQDATGIVTYQSCAAAGMSASETAAAMGVKVGAVYGAARRFGLVFRDTRRERMKALHADPEFNSLAALLSVERADYDVLVKKGGLSRGAALTAVGRGDLVRA